MAGFPTVNSHVQPSDNPSPVPQEVEIPQQRMPQLAQMGPTPATFGDLSAPVEPPPQPAVPAASGQQQDLAQQKKDLLKELKPQQEKDDEAALAEFNALQQVAMGGSPLDAQAEQTGIGILPERNKGEGMFDYLKRAGVSELKYLSAQNIANLDPRQNTQLAFEKIYGKDNVKVKGDQVYFKSDDDNKFRKADQAQAGLVLDFVARHAASIPGMVAGGAPVAAGSLVGGPAGAVVGFTGGVAGQTATDLATKGLLESVASIDGKSTGVNTDDFVLGSIQNAIAGAVTLGLFKGVKVGAGWVGDTAMAKAIGQKLDNWGLSKLTKTLTSKGAGEILPVDKLSKASLQEKGAQIITALENTVSQIEGAGYRAATKEGEEKASKAILGVVEKSQKQLSNNIEAVVGKAKEIAQTNKTRVPMENLKTTLKKELEKFDYKFDGNGYPYLSTETISLPGPGNVSKQIASGASMGAYGKEGGEGVVKDLANQYTKLLDQEIAHGGIPGENVFNLVRRLQDSANFDSGSRDAVNHLFGRLQRAAAGDRDGMLQTMFKGSGLPEEQLLAGAYKDFSSKIASFEYFQKLLETPETKELLINSLVKSAHGADAAIKKVKLVSGLKDILGDGSKEWDLVRGEYLNGLITKNVDQATSFFNAKGFLQELGLTPPALRNMLFKPEELKVIAQVGREAMEISHADATLSQYQKKVMENAIDFASHTMGNEGGTLKMILKLFSHNKHATDYAIDEGFLNAARKASGPQKETIVKALNLARELRDEYKPAKSYFYDKKGNKKYFDRYVTLPQALSGAAASTTAREVYQEPKAPQPAIASQQMLQ